MSFSRAKPAGWAFGELLTSAQMNTIDENQSRALDGVGGGTYELGNPLRLESSPLSVETLVADAATCTSLDAASLAVSGAAELDGGVVITGSATVVGPISVASTVNATTLSLAADAIVGGSLTVAGKINGSAGTAVFDEHATVEGNLAIGGNVSITGKLDGSAGTVVVDNLLLVEGNATVQGAITATLPSSVPWRIADGPTSDATIVAANYDVLIAVIGEEVTWTLSTTNCVEGMRLIISNRTPAAFNLIVEAGSEDATVGPGECALYVFHETAWRVLKKW